MAAAPYTYLSRVYDAEWGRWSTQYVAFLDAHVPVQGPLDVLDLGCGTGRLAAALAHRGHRVLGIDASPEMIAVARSRAAAGTEFEIADMVSFRSTRRFDLVSCTFDALNYVLELPRLQELASNVADALRPRGAFVFDANTDVLYSRHHHGVWTRELGGERFEHECVYDEAARLATTTFRFSDGREERHLQRPRRWDELEPVLRTAGLRPATVCSGFLGQPLAPETERIVCVATKV